jgi:threonine dehydratase
MSGAAPTLRSVMDAAARIAPHVHRTPLHRSSALDAHTGYSLFFKCESFQRTGSFKIRGATNAIFSLSEDAAARGVVTQSSGNHGMAVALAARLRGIEAHVVVPCVTLPRPFF